MSDADGLRYTKIPLNNSSDEIPAFGFGTLIADPIATKEAVRLSLESGFRQFDCAERYRNEVQVGEAMREVLKEGKVKRKDVFVGTKLWNNNHRPERVRSAFEESLRRLQVEYVDLYSAHTPFAFKAGDEQDPRDENGHVIYDDGVTLTDTWKALESLVDEGRCKAIGVSNVGLGQLKEVFESARIKPAVVQVESHPYLPEWELLDYCKRNGIVMQAFAALGHGIEPRLLDDPVIAGIAKRVNKTRAQVLLAWALQRGIEISEGTGALRMQASQPINSSKDITIPCNELSSAKIAPRTNRIWREVRRTILHMKAPVWHIFFTRFLSRVAE